MTKAELLELIKSFNKTAGNFSQDEIYAIGKAHKQLLKEEKSWSELAETIGWQGTSESLRGFINNRMRKDGTLEKNPKVLSDKTIEEVSAEDFQNLKEELMKQQQKTRDEWSTLRRLIRDEARLEVFKDLIKGTAKELNALPKCVYGNKRDVSAHSEAILLLSDLHIGVKCDNFYNKYDVKIAKQRVDTVVNDTIKYCKLHKVSQLNVCNLGDMIHGLIHINARIEQEMDVVNQIMIASEILAVALNKLQEAAPTVIYRSVIDNHSRATANKKEAIETENFNKIIDWFLEERLKGTSIIFRYDNIDEGIGKFNLLNGKRVMFSHGHQDNINTVFQHFVGATREFIDYALLGHYHSEKAKTYNGFRVIVNGSIVGTEQYALGKRLFGIPSQTLLIFDDSNLINISIELSEINN